MRRKLQLYTLLIVATIFTMSCNKEVSPSVATSIPTFEYNSVSLQNGQLTFNTRLSMKGEVLTIGSKTKRGFFWATHSLPTDLDNSLYDTTSGQGTYTLQTDKFEFSTTYYVRAFAENSVSRVYGEVIEVTSPNKEEILSTLIGTPYQGGLIAVLDENGHGTVVSITDLGKMDWVNAKQACDNLTLNGFNDWSLPNTDVLDALYTNRDLIGGFETSVNSYYWSSEEYDTENAISRAFFNNSQYIRSKNSSDYVRPVRSF